MLNKIDDFVVDRIAQPIADRINQNGITTSKAVTEKLFFMDIFLATVWVAGHVYKNDLDVLYAIEWLVLVTFVPVLIKIVKMENTKQGMIPNNRYMMVGTRLVSLFLNITVGSAGLVPPTDILAILNTVIGWISLIAFYLWACRIQPPMYREMPRDIGMQYNV